MDINTFKKFHEHGTDMYYGENKIKVIRVYEGFGFVDVVKEQDDTVFSLPISIIETNRVKSNFIYLNKIYNLSKY